MEAHAAELGYLPNADGSVLYTSDKTSIIASINGPIEVKPRDEHASETFLEIVIRPSAGITSVREKYLESRLVSAIKPLLLRTLHPRTLHQITVQIVQYPRDGNSNGPRLLAPAINAVVLALADAGVPMRALLAAACVEVAGGGVHVLAYTITGAEEGLTFLESEGEFGVGSLVEAEAVGREVCAGLGEHMKGWIAGKVKGDLRYRLVG